MLLSKTLPQKQTAARREGRTEGRKREEGGEGGKEGKVLKAISREEMGTAKGRT